MTTPEELELLAESSSDSLNNQQPLILVPTRSDESSSESSSLSTQDLGEHDEAVVHPNEQPEPTHTFVRVRRRGRNKRNVLVKEVDVDQYMASREMTPQQERWNAITMIPSPLYCLYFLLAGLWVSPSLVEQAKVGRQDAEEPLQVLGWSGLANDVIGDDNGCIHSRFHNMPALPPLPVLAVAVGIILHAPFSFLYHYKYAHALPPGLARTTHWSRRMDQSMIHVASAFMSFATSGSWDFFVANLLYNADCVYRQFKLKVRPRRNQIRIIISFLAYTMPILRRGDFVLFGRVWTVFLVSGWLFVTYPIGGWSHAVFHLIMTLLPPLLMTAACQLPAAQYQMRLAAECAAGVAVEIE